MKNQNNLTAETEMSTLRAGIKNKYRQYHLLDRDRFPDFDHNTNRANYEPLRASFEEEFYIVRGIDRTNPDIHIPSTNTLALLFTDDSYAPARRIRNTCQLYAEVREYADLNTNGFIVVLSKKRKAIKVNRRLLWGGLLLIVVGLALFMYLTQSRLPPGASGLIIYQPYHGQTVPRIVSFAGKVTNADVVWIVVRPMTQDDKYYVQSPIRVEEDGTWEGEAYIGSPGKVSVGIVFQVRAFVNPGGTYTAIETNETYIFDSWPEKAELSTEVIEVVREPEIEK